MNRETIKGFVIGKEFRLLLSAADRCRKQHCGDEVHLRGIIEYTNNCVCRCAYCGISLHNKKVRRYRLAHDEVIGAALRGAAEGVRTIVLQGGEDPQTGAGAICRMIEGIKRADNVAVTVSAGEWSRRDYRMMRDAGADRYLLKIETANPVLFNALRPGSSFENRVRCLHDLQDLGFQVGSGSLVGLPDQTIDDVINDLLFCSRMELAMATFSPFIPHINTPLKNARKPDPDIALRVLAAARLVLPRAHIPVSTALAALVPNGYEKGLQAGANVVMADLTPADAAALYDLYPGKAETSAHNERDSAAQLKRLIGRISRPLAEGRGDALRAESIGGDHDGRYRTSYGTFC